MKKTPTELEVELHKLVSEAIDCLFDAGEENMAKHIENQLKAIVKKAKQSK